MSLYETFEFGRKIVRAIFVKRTPEEQLSDAKRNTTRPRE